MQQFPGHFGGMPPMGFNQGFGTMPPMGMMGGMPPMGGPMPGLPPMGSPALGLGMGGGPAQTMPTVHGPAQVSLQELRIKPQEAQLFDQLFQHCDPSGSGLITGSAIKGLMTKSKLNKNILAGIWALSDKQKRKALDRENFAVSLRLVSLAQNGLPVSELGLKQYVDVPLPLFEGLQLGASQQQHQQPQSQQPVATPSMDQSFGVPAPSPAAATGPVSEWAMTADERAQYASLFGQADEDQDGFVNAKEAKFFKQSGLDNKTLKQVWLLADADKDNKLNHEEFSIAMHLTLKVRKGLTLPATLPDVLLPGAKKGANGFDGFGGPSASMSSLGGDFAPAPQKSSGGFDDFGPMGSSSNSGHATPTGFATPSMQSADANGFGGPSAAPAQPQPVQIQPTNFFPGGSAAAFINSNEEEQDKFRIMTRTLSTAQSSLHHQADQLKGLESQLSLFNQKTRMLIEQVNKTGMEYTHLQQLIAEEQAKIDAKKNEMAKLDEDNNGILTKIQNAREELESKKTELKDTQQKIIDAHTTIPSVKKETQEIDMQIAILESQLVQARQTWKQIEDTKNTQASILAARKDQAAKLLREKQEVQDMLDTAQLELAKIKNEATVVKENIPVIHSSIADMRGDLKELQELVEEERKNPTARSQVSINAKGELELGAAKLAPPPAAAARPVATAAAKPAVSLGFGDDDDDFAVPDIQLPGPGAKPAPPKATAPPPPAAISSKSSGAIFDDGDDFAVPDIALPGLGGLAKSAASGGFGDFGDFGGSSVPAAAPAANNGADPFGTGEDWGADPFASTSTTVSAPSASSTASVSAGFDDFGGADPFGSTADFGVPAAASKPAPPAASSASPRGTAPPPPPPGAAPPTPKTTTSLLPTPKPATPQQALSPKPAATGGFADDDGWDVPDGVPGGDAVKADDWSGSAGHDDWGF